MTTSAAKSRDRSNALKDAYSEVFTCYYFCLPTTLHDEYRSVDHIKKFASAVERASLLCSKRSEHFMNELLFEILSGSPNYERCSFLVSELRKSAKQDVRNCQRHQNSTEFQKQITKRHFHLDTPLFSGYFISRLFVLRSVRIAVLLSFLFCKLCLQLPNDFKRLKHIASELFWCGAFHTLFCQAFLQLFDCKI